MTESAIDRDDVEAASVEELLARLQTDPEAGLSNDEVRARQERYGFNELHEEQSNPLLEFGRYFWGPIPWMIEVAAILSAAVRHWPDFILIMALLIINAVIGFWEERKAANALDALKDQLALKSRALRNGKWAETPARELVPGDVLRLRLGDIVPADVKLIDGDYLRVDQSALTGESLPVDKAVGGVAYSGTVAKQGEMVAVVTTTGEHTFFGRTAKLVEAAGGESHFQKAVMRIGNFLIAVALVLSVVLVGVELWRGSPAMRLIQFVLILVVASIPVAMPAVLSVTMALGARALSKMKAIVSRLQSIEEMAGIDILCSDKTGTLTQNKLTLGEPVLFEAQEEAQLIRMAALASREENQDAIDLAVLQQAGGAKALEGYRQVKFTPFDPVSKRTEGLVETGEGEQFRVTKGAPQVVLEMSTADADARRRAEQAVDDMASRGYRTLGVARADESGQWHFLGILSLYDPPREDSLQTIADARAHGIDVKIVTGDHIAIGSETSGQLGLGRNLLPADALKPVAEGSKPDPETIRALENADGFAQVFPEHKYDIVRILQAGGHIVGMTGDGVNDAPALKQADVGIAVSGATDAARAAASLVLTGEGLSVIIHAVEEARRIFERMMSYTIYRIAMTFDIMIFVVLAMLTYEVYPLTAIMIILLALLDDIPIMTIAYDNTWLDPNPVRWRMGRVLSISSILGALAVVETFGMMWFAKAHMALGLGELQTVMFLQLVAGGHLMLFVTRSKRGFWQKPLPSWQLFTAIVATQAVAVLLAGFGWLMPAIPWSIIGIVWVYNLIWMVFQDGIKLVVYRLLDQRAQGSDSMGARAGQPAHAEDAA